MQRIELNPCSAPHPDTRCQESAVILLLVTLQDKSTQREENPTDEDMLLLDKVATLTQADNDAFSEMQAMYAHGKGLRVAHPIMCYSPVARPRKVKLTV